MAHKEWLEYAGTGSFFCTNSIIISHSSVGWNMKCVQNKKKEKKDGWVIVSIIPTDGAVFSPSRDPHLSQTQINVRSPSISPSFHLPRLLLRSNPPDANLSVYLSVWPPVAGMCRGLYFLHLADCRLCGAAALYAYEIGLLWLGMWFKGPYQVIRVFFFFFRFNKNARGGNLSPMIQLNKLDVKSSLVAEWPM